MLRGQRRWSESKLFRLTEAGGIKVGLGEAVVVAAWDRAGRDPGPR
jgi:hypothetical protein